MGQMFNPMKSSVEETASKNYYSGALKPSSNVVLSIMEAKAETEVNSLQQISALQKAKHVALQVGRQALDQASQSHVLHDFKSELNYLNVALQHFNEVYQLEQLLLERGKRGFLNTDYCAKQIKRIYDLKFKALSSIEMMETLSFFGESSMSKATQISDVSPVSLLFQFDKGYLKGLQTTSISENKSENKRQLGSKSQISIF